MRVIQLPTLFVAFLKAGCEYIQLKAFQYNLQGVMRIGCVFPFIIYTPSLLQSYCHSVMNISDYLLQNEGQGALEIELRQSRGASPDTLLAGKV